jgi:hypothetical protein
MSLSAFIVGCGRIAGGFNDADESRVLTHAVALRRLGVPIAGCCDVEPDRAARFAARWQVAYHGGNLPDLLAAARPDLVAVCTPAPVRWPVLETVFACPSVRSLLIEKPLAVTGAEAHRIAEAARESGRVVLVDYFRAFDPFYRRLEAEIRQGWRAGGWSATARYYGRATETASHWIERVLACFGPASGARRFGGDAASPLFVLDWAQGSVVFVPATGCAYSPFELDLCFRDRRVRVLDSEERVEHFVSGPDPHYAGYCRLVPEPLWPGLVPSPESLGCAMEAAVAAAAGEPVPWRELLARSVRVVEICEQIGGRQ